MNVGYSSSGRVAFSEPASGSDSPGGVSDEDANDQDDDDDDDEYEDGRESGNLQGRGDIEGGSLDEASMVSHETLVRFAADLKRDNLRLQRLVEKLIEVEDCS